MVLQTLWGKNIFDYQEFERDSCLLNQVMSGLTIWRWYLQCIWTKDHASFLYTCTVVQIKEYIDIHVYVDDMKTIVKQLSVTNLIHVYIHMYVKLSIFLSLVWPNIFSLNMTLWIYHNDEWGDVHNKLSMQKSISSTNTVYSN